MKPPRQPDDDEPQPAPADWQPSDLTHLRKIAEKHPELVAQTAHKLGLSLVELRKISSDESAALIVLLKAEALHWCGIAQKLFTPENRKRARKEKAREIAKAIHEWEAAPYDADLEKVLGLHGVEPDKTGLRNTIFYNWQAPAHESAALRRASGYGESQFRELVSEIVKKLTEPDGPPMKVARAGGSTIYPSVVALLLLDHILQRTAGSRRAQIAEAIWRWWHLCGCNVHPGFRAVLRAAGAQCGARAGQK